MQSAAVCSERCAALKSTSPSTSLECNGQANLDSVIVNACESAPIKIARMSGNFSLNGVAPRAQFYTGLSQRF
jgi:hypothetical protein